MREDRELREFRSLMEAPDTFEDGFGWGTVLMALFVGLIMAPCQLYMQLIAGIGIGGAANWVTVILYVEVARRAFKKLKRPEIFVLFYMCGAMMGTGTSGLLWQQFMAQSEQMRKLGIVQYIPSWFAPTSPSVLAQRDFFTLAWLKPLGLMLIGMFISRLDNFGLGYVMYRLTSDVEKLPFPMAPVGAMGMTALADASSQRETWRWRTFAIGGVGGIAFGFVYLFIPSVSGAIFSKSITILPLPFVDLTSYTEKILPAMPMMLSFDLGLFVLGMVMPFWAMVGGFIGLLIGLVGNPILYRTGVLRSWEPGIGAIQTIQSNFMDFYFSFGLGLSFAIAAIGFFHVFSSLRRKREEMDELGKPGIQWKRLFRPPAGRGDFPIWLAAGIYLFSTCTYIGLAYWLINFGSGPLEGPAFPLWLLIFYGFVYTPVISYVSARMEGIVGMQVDIPFVRQATFILSGYKGAAVWFAPFPMHNYAGQVVMFRTAELTGTRFRSIVKAEILIFPILFIGTVIFSQFIWSMGPVPSELFPYANQFWELNAYQQGLTITATLPEGAASPFREAFNPAFLGGGFGLALLLYIILDRFSLTVFLIYGVVRGLNQALPHSTIPMFLGALFGRYLGRKWFGEKWPQYRIVFAAGFTAGIGLIMMLGLGFVLMSKSVIKVAV